MSGGLSSGWARLAPSWRRFVAIAVTWYAVVATFGVAYLIVRRIWPQTPVSTAVTVGVLTAGPLVLAFTWERLTGLRLLGVEVTLSQATVPVDQTLATALSESAYFSGNEAIFKLVDRAIGNPKIELLELNLRTTNYWWSTRLYLQAALVEDRTKIQRLVFVEGDAQRRYVGMATPAEVRRALAQPPGMNLELVYRQIEQDVRQTPGPPDHSEVRRIVETWSMHMFSRIGQAVDVTEEAAKMPVSSALLAEWVTLERESVDWDQPLDSALLQALVLDKETRFVPLTQNGKLDRVVNADAFARRATTQALRARLR
jgi:hypothetical protein